MGYIWIGGTPYRENDILGRVAQQQLKIQNAIIAGATRESVTAQYGSGLRDGEIKAAIYYGEILSKRKTKEEIGKEVIESVKTDPAYIGSDVQKIIEKQEETIVEPIKRSSPIILVAIFIGVLGYMLFGRR